MCTCAHKFLARHSYRCTQPRRTERKSDLARYTLNRSRSSSREKRRRMCHAESWSRASASGDGRVTRRRLTSELKGWGRGKRERRYYRRYSRWSLNTPLSPPPRLPRTCLSLLIPQAALICLSEFRPSLRPYRDLIKGKGDRGWGGGERAGELGKRKALSVIASRLRRDSPLSLIIRLAVRQSWLTARAAPVAAATRFRSTRSPRST